MVSGSFWELLVASGSVWEHLESVLAASRTVIPAHKTFVLAHKTAVWTKKILAQAFKSLKFDSSTF